MDSADLSRQQIEALEARVRPMLAWLSKLSSRMDHRGWSPDDRLRELAWTSRNALHDLSVELHQMRTSGMGRPSRPR
jgi:hypothetical protein